MKKITFLLFGIMMSTQSFSQINTSGILMDGLDDYIYAPHIPAYDLGTGNFTLEMWIRMNSYQFTANGGITMLLSYSGTNGTGFSFCYLQNNGFAVFIGNAAYIFPAFNFTFNTCHHVAVVRSGTVLTLYADGVLRGSISNVTASMGTNTEILSIGNGQIINTDFRNFGGFMHEVRFWNIARSQSSILSTMFAPLTGGEPGLIGYWRCNELSGTNINDFSPSNNDGTTTSGASPIVFTSGCSNCSPIPNSTITAAGPTTFCYTGYVDLVAPPGYTYIWLRDGLPTAIFPQGSQVQWVNGTHSHTCAINNGCGNIISNAISTTEIPGTPVASITAAGPVVFCPPGFVTLNATSGAGLTYQWKINGNAIAGATASAYVANAAGNYSCAVSNVCGATNTNTIAVTLNSAPASPGIITGPATGVCSTVKTYSISAVANATSYSWTTPAGASVSGGQGTTSVSITFTNTYAGGLVSVTAVNGCGSSAASSLSVSGAPAQPGSITGPVSVCHNQNNVVYSIAAVATATSYTWTAPPGTNIKSGQGTRTIKVRFGNSGGSITVKANNSCGSGPVRSLAVAMPCREGEETLEETTFGVTVFPNPSTKDFTILANPAGNGFYALRIIDLTGRIVESYPDISSSTALVCGENLAAGVYVAEIISGGSRHVQKIVKK